MTFVSKGSSEKKLGLNQRMLVNSHKGVDFFRGGIMLVVVENHKKGFRKENGYLLDTHRGFLKVLSLMLKYF